MEEKGGKIDSVKLETLFRDRRKGYGNCRKSRQMRDECVDVWILFIFCLSMFDSFLGIEQTVRNSSGAVNCYACQSVSTKEMVKYNDR